jgi:outer membrane protein OmpA-like peptidoglycan-associated protein
MKNKNPIIFFALAAILLPPIILEAIEIEQELYEFEMNITDHTPLIITGHSCELGTEQSNLILARQRAVAVINFLESRGFTATTLQAKEEADPITTNTKELYKNRRVEITAQLPTQ